MRLPTFRQTFDIWYSDTQDGAIALVSNFSEIRQCTSIFCMHLCQHRNIMNCLNET